MQRKHSNFTNSNSTGKIYFFKTSIESIFPKLYSQPTPDACFVPVVQAAAQAFQSADRAGKLFMFHSSLPSANAPGKLANRDDRKLIGKLSFRPITALHSSHQSEADIFEL